MVFFFDALYSLYTRTTLPLSLRIYNDDAMGFMTFWYLMYSPHKNHIYFHFRKCSLFLWFWHNGLHVFSGDKHCFCVPYNPLFPNRHYSNQHLSDHPLTTIQRHTLSHWLHFTHISPMYAQTSPQNMLLLMTYLHPFYHTNILLFFPVIPQFQIRSLIISHP